MSETAEAKRNENWRKFWKIVKIMPLALIMPMTAVFKMQAVVMGTDKKPENAPGSPLATDKSPSSPQP